jgi:phage-related protein
LSPAPKTLQAVFYRTASGGEPVRDWLKDELSAGDRKIVGVDIATVEYGWPVGMPVCRPLGNGLREVRSSLPGGRIARVIFCIAGDRMVLLSGFIKKTQKTPQTEIDKAARRMKEVM